MRHACTPNNGSARRRGRRVVAFASAVVTAAAVTLVGSALPAAAAGTTWHVDHTNGSDGDGCGHSSGAGACATIGAALATAGDGDTVSIAPGTYSEAVTISDAISLEGTSQTGVVLNNPSTDDTPTITIDATGPVTIAQMTITPATPSDSVQNTVGVEAESGSTVTVSQVTVSNPASVAVGGVHAAGGSTVSLERSTLTGLAFGVIVGNLPGDGTSVPATLSVTSSTITDNNSGILVAAGTATITGGSVSGNQFAGLAGLTSDATLDVSGTSITDNAGPESGTAAGVMLQSGASLAGDHVTISANDVGVMGSGDVSLTNSAVTNNGGTAQDGTPDGGGIVGQPRTDPDSGDPIPLTVNITGTEVSGNTSGVQLPYAHATITDSTIADNAVFGIAADGQDPQHSGTLSLTGSTVSGNGPQSAADIAPSQYPGGLFIADVDATVTGTSFTGNTIGLTSALAARVTVNGGTVADNLLGGVVTAQGVGAHPGMELTDVSITGNGLLTGVAFPWSAGIAVTDGKVTGRGLTVSGNRNGVLVAASTADSTLALTDSVVSGSVHSDDQGPMPTGSGIIAGGSSGQVAHVTLKRSEVSGNDRNGLWLTWGSVSEVTNSTIAGNAAAGITDATPEGAQPQGAAARLLLAGSTMAGNPGGALAVDNGLAVTAAGSILQGPGDASACTGDVSTLTDGGWNLASDNSCGLDTTGAGTSSVGKPLLGKLDNHGGPTRTMLPAPTSPAVNIVAPGATVGQGDAAVTLCGGGAADQRGTARPQGSGCDAGAVERTSGLITVTASDATLYEGGAAPTVTPSYSGFAGTDTLGDLTTPARCGYDQAAGTTSCHGAADDFYDFHYVPGVLTVLQPPRVTTTHLPQGRVEDGYGFTLAASGGATPLSWSITDGALPTGLHLAGTTGAITGIPQYGGHYQFTVTASDANAVTDAQHLTLTITAPACTQRPFPDVPVDSSYCPAVAWITDRGITTGYIDGWFHPERQVTRQTMAAFLYRYVHDGASAPGCQDKPFDDVPVDNAFCGAITWLVKHHITTGYNDHTFRPTEPVTNQTMAAFLYRLDHDGAHAPGCQHRPFADVPIANPFCGAIAWVSGNGIAIGDADGFHPADIVTRGPMAADLYYYDQYQAARTPR